VCCWIVLGVCTARDLSLESRFFCSTAVHYSPCASLFRALSPAVVRPGPSLAIPSGLYESRNDRRETKPPISLKSAIGQIVQPHLALWSALGLSTAPQLRPCRRPDSTAWSSQSINVVGHSLCSQPDAVGPNAMTQADWRQSRW